MIILVSNNWVAGDVGVKGWIICFAARGEVDEDIWMNFPGGIAAIESYVEILCRQ